MRNDDWFWVNDDDDDGDDDDDDGLFIGRIFWLNWTGWKKDEMKPQQCNNGIKLCVCASECKCEYEYELMNMSPPSMCLCLCQSVDLSECVWLYASLFKQHLLCDWHPLVKCITDTVRQVSNFFSPRILYYTHTRTSFSFLPSPLPSTSHNPSRWKWYIHQILKMLPRHKVNIIIHFMLTN